MATVSVILTSFNHERYIREAIESVLNQTFADFELIIWDDCSSDTSWAIINQYSDPRIKAFRNAVNKGPVEGVNRAISEIATGKYIAIHHSDDVWEAEKLDKQVAFLDSHPEYGAVFTHVQIIDELNKRVANEWFNIENKSRQEWLRHFFLRTNYLCHPSVLMRRGSYGDAGLYRLGLPQSADADMWIRLLKLHEIHVIQEKLTLHRLFTDKSNSSGDKSEVRRRLHIEWYALLSHFLTICLDDLLIIFPEARKWIHQEEADANFILAMAALELGIQPEIKLFGLSLLFSLVSVPESAQRIQRLYGFDHFELGRLVGSNEVFAENMLLEKELIRLKNEINRSRGEVHGLQSEILMARREIEEVYASTSWIVTAPFRRARLFLARLTEKRPNSIQ